MCYGLKHTHSGAPLKLTNHIIIKHVTPPRFFSRELIFFSPTTVRITSFHHPFFLVFENAKKPEKASFATLVAPSGVATQNSQAIRIFATAPDLPVARLTTATLTLPLGLRPRRTPPPRRRGQGGPSETGTCPRRPVLKDHTHRLRRPLAGQEETTLRSRPVQTDFPQPGSYRPRPPLAHHYPTRRAPSLATP